MDSLIYKDKGVFCPMCNGMCKQDNCIMFQRIGDKVGGCHYSKIFINNSIVETIDNQNEIISAEIGALADKLNDTNIALQQIAIALNEMNK